MLPVTRGKSCRNRSAKAWVKAFLTVSKRSIKSEARSAKSTKNLSIHKRTCQTIQTQKEWPKWLRNDLVSHYASRFRAIRPKRRCQRHMGPVELMEEPPCLNKIKLIKLETAKRRASRKQTENYNNKIQLLIWFIIRGALINARMNKSIWIKWLINKIELIQ